jgi:UDP-2-acetamido-2,6-beta-L-arabino-hexul-4-ose reductase
MIKVLVTGANGFIGKNLCVRLSELPDVEIFKFAHTDSITELPNLLKQVDFVFHLAGVNRPKDPVEFQQGNAEFTAELCHAVKASDRAINLLYTSSAQVGREGVYSQTKASAESFLQELTETGNANVAIYRLPNVFGKWCRPNYNSAVATFCYNTVNNLPLTIHDPNAELQLVYIDDVVDDFIRLMREAKSLQGFQHRIVSPTYKTTVGQVAEYIQSFPQNRSTLLIDSVGQGLVRSLYSTYLSYLVPDQFKYSLKKHEDPRGVFVEMLKTKESGQFSFFTAHPGVTRGGHYHHSKNEKFLVIKGQAQFKFLHVVTGEQFELVTSAETPEVVETIPGWAHDITNIGSDEMVVMLWANEIFDPQRPDTIAYQMNYEKNASHDNRGDSPGNYSVVARHR